MFDGEVRKVSHAVLYEGSATTHAACSAASLNNTLDDLNHNQAIALGVLKHSGHARIGTASKGAKITRSLKHFEYPTGSGWLLWDFDTKSMPDHVAERITALGGPLEALFKIWPEARDSTYLIRPSSSDGIIAPNGTAPESSNGLHGFF
jgi:hypothetical protein